MARRNKWNKQLSWRLEYWGYLFVETGIRMIPPSLIDYTGSALGFLLFSLSPKYRRLAIRNLRIAFGKEKTPSEIRRLARQTCQRTIANFLGTLKTLLLPSEKITRHVSLLGQNHLAEALAEGKGAILVLGHMGNWEVLNRLHQFLPPGTQAGGIYQPLKNPYIDHLLLKRREQDGSKFFNKHDGFHSPASYVQNGGLLIIVADQKVGRGGTAVPFFNGLSSLSPLPALLARKAGAPVLAAGIETVAPGKWQVVIEPLTERPDTTAIISGLEKLIRRSPADFLWLHNRWRPVGKTPLSISSRKSKQKPLNTTPMRAIFLTTSEPDLPAVKSFLAQRDESDFPLSCEFLIVSEHDEVALDTKDFPSHHSIAPTLEQLAATLTALDSSHKGPLEIALIPTPSPLLEAAAKLAQVPRVVKNTQNLELESFLQSLTADFTKT